jgi:putative flippase GtrA
MRSKSKITSRRLSREANRFVASGILVTCLHIGIAVGFIHFVLPSQTLANGIAFVIATTISYLINTLWSFSAPLRGRNLVRFLIVSSVGFTFAVSVSAIAEHFRMDYWIGIGTVVLIVPPVTFALHKFWTYR